MFYIASDGFDDILWDAEGTSDPTPLALVTRQEIDPAAWHLLASHPAVIDMRGVWPCCGVSDRDNCQC